MSQNRQVRMMISLTKKLRAKVRMLAAEQKLKNPNCVTSALAIVRKLVLEGIEHIERIEANLAPIEE